ncbi:primosomal protein DnaI [Lacticaseibacillus manihotivorans]|jgi:primosomal protein DnaI|uniref:DNA replication protein n=2 Tax=Lacticaseibacillus manihotivorans TaxID=88233 RepID=A0A0R1QNW4_9LACO|nr:primosomal protein DnaI [Lacticaseibacillus manihotivorans]KRL43877.1 DNA replication protein [Lacticaseibacillus manihotivorans DSM 13343 = JCM 12514]QFQ91591.1 primosomal protein DnaI [Lacticaseibacillus manihotivorans]
MKDMHAELQKLMDQRHLTGAFHDAINKAAADPEVQAFLRAHKGELAEDATRRGAAKIYEFVNERDKRLKGIQSFAPGYQPELVVSNGQIDLAYEPTAEKQAEDKLADQKRLINAINMPKAIQHANLAMYDDKDRADALQAAVQFTVAVADQPKDFHKGLYLTGPFGVGKTYLLGAIANELAEQGVGSTLLHVPTYAVEMKNAIQSNSVLAKINAIKVAPVLMLDDIGAEALSPWFRDEVLGIILQYRMQEEMPTLFSSNKTMAELNRFLAGADRGDNEAMKASRIMARIQFLATEISVGGVDRRNGN